MNLIKLNCPYCQVTLPKIPYAKTKCKNCGNYYYKRSYPPHKRNYIIVTAEEKDRIEAEWTKFQTAQNSLQQDRKKINELYRELEEVKTYLRIVSFERGQSSFSESTTKQIYGLIQSESSLIEKIANESDKLKAIWKIPTKY